MTVVHPGKGIQHIHRRGAPGNCGGRSQVQPGASPGKERIMVEDDRTEGSGARSEQLARELEEAELFVQKLHAYIVAIRDELAAGHTGRALSMCNEALTEIDSATDVITPSPRVE